MATIAEDLLLVLLEPSGKPSVDSTRLGLSLGGAVLLELALAGRVGVDKHAGRFARDHVVVLDGSPTGDDVLDGGLRIVAERPRSSRAAVERLSKGVRPHLLRRLEASGAVRHEAEKVLWVFTRDRWPVVDVARQQVLRRRVVDVLVAGAPHDERTAALIALLSAVDHAHKVPGGLDGAQRRHVKARAKEIARGDWAAEAVRSAVQAAQSAVAASSVAVMAAAGAAGS